MNKRAANNQTKGRTAKYAAAAAELAAAELESNQATELAAAIAEHEKNTAAETESAAAAADAEYAAQSKIFNDAEKVLQEKQASGEIVTSTDKINAAINADLNLIAVLKDDSVDSNSAELQDAIKEYIVNDTQTEEKLSAAFNQSSDDLAAAASALAFVQSVTDTTVPETAEQMLARVKAERAALLLRKQEFDEKQKVLIADAKIKRAAERELAAYQAELAAFEKAQNTEIDLDALDDEENSVTLTGKDYKVSQADQEKFFIAALVANGNTVTQIKILRDYWKAHSAEFAAIAKEKQQKAIMRRTLHRLCNKGICTWNNTSTVITLNTSKLEELKKSEESK